MPKPITEAMRDAFDRLANEPIQQDGFNFFITPTVGCAIESYKSIQEARDAMGIRNILVNKKKRLVTVVFKDGEHEIIKCAKEDKFDVNVGVALAVAQHLYGSKTKFHKIVTKKSKTI